MSTAAGPEVRITARYGRSKAGRRLKGNPAISRLGRAQLTSDARDNSQLAPTRRLLLSPTIRDDMDGARQPALCNPRRTVPTVCGHGFGVDSSCRRVVLCDPSANEPGFMVNAGHHPQANLACELLRELCLASKVPGLHDANRPGVRLSLRPLCRVVRPPRQMSRDTNRRSGPGLALVSAGRV